MEWHYTLTKSENRQNEVIIQLAADGITAHTLESRMV